MAYTDLDKIKSKISEEDIVNCLFDPKEDSGEAAIDNPAVLSKLDECIEEGDNIIDGYVGGKYPTPLDLVPGLVKNISRSLAVYFINQRRLGDRMPDSLEQMYDRQVSQLKGIQSGGIRLDAPGHNSSEPINRRGAYRCNKVPSDKIFTKELFEQI